MARINTNIAAFIAQTNLARNQKALQTSLARLSQGSKITSAADDPAGLIASESLRAEINGINAAIDNSTRASNVLATAEGALDEVSNLLVSIKQLTISSASTGALSQEEIQANQLQVDSAVASISRISNSTSFAGLKLLDGSLAFLTSGLATSALHDMQIQAAQFGTNRTIPVSVNVSTSAKTAALYFRTSAVASTVSLEIAGKDGAVVLNFVSGTAASAIAYAVNRNSDSTGVHAALINNAHAASGITFTSSAYGSRAFVSVTNLASTSFVTSSTSATATAAKRTTGQDAVATINGTQATADGLKLSLNTPALAMSLTLDTAMGVATKTFTITGGGAIFQLGSHINSNEQVDLAFDSVSSSRLGSNIDGYLTDIVTGGTASLTGGHAASAAKIIDGAITQVAVIRGRLGAFEKNTLQTNVNSLQIALENVTSSESSLRDTDFATETSALTRAQILVQAGTSVLATANSSPQSVLTLLTGR